MTRRILQIIPTLDRGGAEKQLTLLAAGLPKDRFDVHVCALTRSGPLAADLVRAEIPLVVIGKRWKVDPLAYWQLRRHIRALRPDVVQTWLFAANAYGRAAALAAGTKAIVASERSVDPWKVDYELAIDRWLGKQTHRIVVNSPGIRDFYVEHGLPASKFVTIPNGIDPPTPSTLSRVELLRELGLPSETRLIGAVGRLWPQKRIKDVICAAELLNVIRKDVHLLIVGDGPQRAMLERFRDQMEIEDKVHFLGNRADVARIMPHFDLLWLASEYEGLPNVIMEAMACGVPVVATRISGNTDLVEDGRTGFLVPVGDRAGLARQARKILDDPNLARQLAAAGRERILADYRVERMIARYADLYDELLGGST